MTDPLPDGALVPADVPVALFPVGLETRFFNDVLWIRVTPDQIAIDQHEPALEEAEAAAGQRFWEAVWRAGTATPAATEAELAAFTELANTLGDPRRAAWVADQTTPSGERPEEPIPPGQPLPEPGFPDTPRRPPGWTQPARARTLPDRFIAIAYQRMGSGGSASYAEIGRAEGQPVDQDLPMGFGSEPTPPAANADGPELPDELRWLINSDDAGKAGLLLKLALPAATTHIDRLLVLGVRGSLAPEAGAAQLAALLDAHHYTDGLEVLPIGTATNNSAADTSAYASRTSPAGAFATERGTPTPPDGSDGELLARALGIPAATLRGVAHSNDTEQAAAAGLNALVWPPTIGYWLETLALPGADDGTIAELRAHTLAWVRARGPLPPLRVGRQPYGVLPATSLQAWQAPDETAALARLAAMLRRAYPWWQDGAEHAPLVRAERDPDNGLLDALSQLAVSREVAVRSLVGANACFVPDAFAQAAEGSAFTGDATRQQHLAHLALLDLEAFTLPPVADLVASPDPAPLLRLPYTVDFRLPPGERDAAWAAIAAYLNGLRDRKTAELAAELPDAFTSLLALVAWRAVMLARLRAGLSVTRGKTTGLLTEAQLRTDNAVLTGAELISTTAALRIGDIRSAPRRVLSASVSLADGSTIPMPDYLDQQLLPPASPAAFIEYVDTINAAANAAALAPERAQLLLGEALDLASHRLDAWITSLATRRLAEMRAVTPTGITLGAYGVVEDLVLGPNHGPPPVPGSGEPGGPGAYMTDTRGGGYIHAPSLAQAATAAVLRAGQIAHAQRDPASAALAIDLSSARVRAALALLDGVRQGQSLGALLGYRVERQLQENGQPAAVEVVRALAPPPVVTAQGTAEGMPPRAVCDGLALSRLARDDVIPQMVAAGVGEDLAMRVLGELADAVDGLADLLLAEGVHQIVAGNPERAAAALDTLNRGEGAPVEPDIVSTPRAAASITQRIVIALGSGLRDAPGWPTDGVRARAEPRVASWAGELLGNAADLPLTVIDPTQPPLVFPLGDLEMGALDVVYEGLATRALRHARGRGASPGAYFDADAPAVAALLAMADLLAAVLRHGREGNGFDFVRAQDRDAADDAAPPPDVDRGDRYGRLYEARQRLRAARDALPVLEPGQPAPPEADLTAALDALAAFGLAPGDPSLPPSAETLSSMRSAATALLDRAEGAPDDPRALFGDGFLVLPLVASHMAETVNAALGADPLGVAPDALLDPLGGRDHALESWLENTGRVRAGAGRLADLLLAARLRGTAPQPALRAMQLPDIPFPSLYTGACGQWVGLPFPAPLDPEPVTSIVMHARGQIDAAAGCALIVVDEFAEAVPSEAATTGLAFGFDAPAARPPQSVLLAVPPVPGQAWSVDALAGVIGETIDLAKIRMVDLSSVAWAGRFLPALYLTDGDVGNGVDLPMKDIVKAANQRWKEVQT